MDTKQKEIVEMKPDIRSLQCPFRSLCTKAKEGNNRRIYYNKKWERQKKIITQLLSEEKTGKIYGKRKIDVEPVFGYLKTNLRFTRVSVRGKENMENELGFAFMDNSNKSKEKGF